MKALLLVFIVAAVPLCAELQLVSGNGQLVQEQFASSAPMLVRAVDAGGRAVPNLQVTWDISGPGSIRGNTRSTTTDANGYASNYFLATDIQPGTSWAQATVSATSALGVVPFTITTVQSRVGSGPAPLPSVQMVGEGQITGTAGSIIREAFKVQVVATAGIRLGQGIPNVGAKVVLRDSADPATEPSGTCNAPGGLILTDSRGLATCDLILNRNIGTGTFYVLVGDVIRTRGTIVQITPAEQCIVTISPASQSFAASGGTSSISVSSSQSCSWTATTSDQWITFIGGAAGSGNGMVTFSVAANTGATRTGNIAIGNQTFTVTQGAPGSGGTLSFSVATNLPPATVGSPYSFALNGSGGQPPYSWSTTGAPPPGLALNAGTGVVSGVPSTAGTYTLPVTIRDVVGAATTQTFTLVVSPASTPGGPLVITTTSFPAGSAGVPYSYPVTASGGCQNPFFGGPVFSVASGSLPTGLSLQSSSSGLLLSGTPTLAGTFVFALRVADACGASTSRDYTITISAAPTTAAMTSSPASVSLVVTQGSTTPAEQSIAIATGANAIAFTVSATSSPVSWLSVSPASGATPANLLVRAASFSDLPAGTYTGSILVISQAPNSPITIPVSLTVLAGSGLPPMTVNVQSLSFTAARGSTPPEQTLSIATGGTALAFTAVAASTPTNWLSVTPSSGTTPANLVVRATNVTDLAAGTYLGSITITSQAPNGPITIPVSLTISGDSGSPVMTVNVQSLSFTVVRGSAPPEQTLSIATGNTTLAFTAVAASAPTNWLSVTPASGTSPANLAVRVAGSADLPAGTYSGSITISSQASNGPITIPVSLTVTGSVNAVIAPAELRFDYEVGGIVPGSQTLTVSSSGGPLSFSAVAGTRTGGQWLSITPNGGSAPSTIAVSVNPLSLPPATYQGTISITPGTTGVAVSVPVTLNVTQPGPQIGSIVNGASFLPGPISPGEIVTLFGANLGPQTLQTLRITPAGLIDSVLSGVRVWFDDQPAPLIHVSGTQITVVAPYWIAGRRSVRIQSEYGGVRSAARDVPVAPSAPGLFTIGGGSQGAILNQDGTVNSPQNGADPGTIVSLFATGEGETTPAGVEGTIVSALALAKPVLPVSVLIGGRQAEVLYAGSAPGMPAGLLQVNARIPADATGGPVQVVLIAGSSSSQAGVTVFVRR